jgi:RNA polymerase sigma-70 factor (ECF subfamily)
LPAFAASARHRRTADRRGRRPRQRDTRDFLKEIPVFDRLRQTGVRSSVAFVHSCHTCPHYVTSVCDARCHAVPESPCDSCTETGDARHFAALFEAYQGHVVAWACRITGSYELARDLAQDVFVKAWSGMEAFRGDSQFTTWLYTITRNRCHDYMRGRAVRPREVDDRVLTTTGPTVDNDAVAWLERQHAARLVRRLMADARLDRLEARAFTLHYGYDVPLRVVTARLALTNTSGARARLVSATRKLRRSAARWRHVAVRRGRAEQVA